MYPKAFEYYKPANVDDALSYLQTHQDSKIIAGGQSLIPAMKLRIASPSALVDIRKLNDLNYVRDGTNIKIGSLTTHAQVAESSTIKEKLPILSQTAENIGDLQVRTLGTIGGSICHADPAADYLPTLLVLDARMTIRSKSKGRRSTAISEFLQGPFTTTMQEDEILEEIALPTCKGTGAVRKFARRKADFAVVAVAALLDVEHGGLVKDLKIAIAPQQNSATRLHKLESAIKNKRFKDQASLDTFVRKELANEELDFPADIHGSSSYRKQVAESIIPEMICTLYEKQNENRR
jgi:CO/xanthine dehydrogenase FAD-binding subunit